MLVVENTQDQVVGTVHLVTKENLFVAKTSAPPKTRNTASGTQHDQSQEEGDSLENWRVCVCVSMCFHARTQALQDRANRRMLSQCDQTHKHADDSTCLDRRRSIPGGQKEHVNRRRQSSRAGPPHRGSGTTPGPPPGQRADLDVLDKLSF